MSYLDKKPCMYQSLLMGNLNQGRSLELFFIDGNPDGMLTAEVFNWTGHVLMTPRTRIAEALRLHGIDAPETKQECSRQDGKPYRCGETSTDALRVLFGSDPVRCEGDTYDRYKRLIAVCYIGTVNLNAELVRQGWALAYRRYSKDYVSAEKEAQEAKRGMWAGEFEPPWEWRRK